MSSPWGKVSNESATNENFADIMSEQYAHRLHKAEIKRHEKNLCSRKENEESKSVQTIWGLGDSSAGGSSLATYSEVSTLPNRKEQESKEAEKNQLPPDVNEWESYSALLKSETEQIPNLPDEMLALAASNESDSDAVIAQMLQSQFDHEYNEELRRIESQHNKKSKVTVTLDKFHRNGGLEFLRDTEYESEEEDEMVRLKRDWDRFETNEKILETMPKCGFKVDKEGEMITKHDAQLCGVRNACRVMSFPPEFPTGDGAGFDMKLSNQVFNQLKTYSRRGMSGKKNKKNDRKENFATIEFGVDAPTRLLLFKLINNQILEQINGIISTGKEAVILHANSDPSYTGRDENSHHQGSRKLTPPYILPKECAIKIFKTTLNEFKQRDRYIKDDFRFKDRFSKQNNRVIINMWAEKEMHNLMRMQNVGLNCPDVVVLKKHVLVMSFIGQNHNAAPKLKDALLNDAELSCAYEEIVLAMYKMYNLAKLVHADLSEYNILWYNGKCWFIDVAQSVEPEHPSALEFLMRDCVNIVKFFSKRGLPNIYTKEQLFKYITTLDAEAHNAAMLERIHTRGASIVEATVPNQQECPDEMKPLEYPFELAWEKSQMERQKMAEEKAVKAKLEETLVAIQELNLNSNPISTATKTTITEKGATNLNQSTSKPITAKH